MSTETPHSKSFLLYLMLTAVLCGALIMVVEILGSRVVGPFFGVGLFVWTSLIAVTLLALALGYWVGGHWADDNDDPARLYGIILISGLLVLVIPFIKAPILTLCMPLGLRTGAFVSTLLLFGPSLFLLGCVSPYLVKIATQEFRLLGRTVGRLYALSTFGSVAGTTLAGFFLIAYLGVNTIFQMTGGLLILIALGYFVGFKRKWVFLSFLLLPMFALQTHTPVNKVMDNGTRVSEILSTESFYGSIKVVDYTYGKQHIRDLMIDGMRQGGVDMQTGLPIYDYAYLMEFLPYAMNSTGKDALVVGLGAGMIPLWYERQGIKTDVVEIDPVIAEVTKNYFDFSISGKVNISDARYYFLSTEKKYDYIVLDVFNGDLTPGHLISLEAFELAKRVMNEGGVFSLNLIANIGNEAYMTASVVKTLEQVFDNVDLYGTASLREGGNSNAGNLILLAYDGEQRNADISTLSHLDIYPGVRSDVESSLTHQVELPRQRAIVLTDDYNPMDFFDSGAREEVRLSILRNSEPDLLFN